MLLKFKNPKTKGTFELNAVNEEMALFMIDTNIKNGYQLSLTDEVEELLVRVGKIKKY